MHFYCRGACCAIWLLVLMLPGFARWASAADNVAGNLINFDNDGMWSWYMDERVIYDPYNGKLLIGSNSSSPVRYPTGRPDGSVDVFTYDPATGDRNRVQLSDIGEDDHNAPGLMILPNGKYLAMYSNHGNVSLGDYFTRYRVSTNPHDSSSWTPGVVNPDTGQMEYAFLWGDPVAGAPVPSGLPPGWNTAPNANNHVSYHNLYYLSDDDGGNGRIYNFSRGTHQSANALIFDQDTNTATWGGQLTQSSTGGYSTGYVKYASNGTDKIYFLSTETHPRNFNNNLWAGYISDGKTYDMAGTVIDTNLFNNEDSAGVGAVPDINTFTNVALADGNTLLNPAANPNANGPGLHRLWTVDMSLASDGNPVAMYIGRIDTGTGDHPGTTSSTIDHRIYYSRWNGSSWQSTELARMGNRLYNSEEDYTGNGALVPGDPNIVYVSTQYDPSDPSGATVTSFREIYKGVTSNGGANWTWTPITSGSTVHNLRPLVPEWDADHRAVVWFRGTYTSAQNTDTSVVGIIEQNDTTTGLVHYVDASTGNTTLYSGAALGATGPSTAEGNADNNWHWRTGAGNNSDVLASGGSGSENANPIKTTLTGLADGVYDIFAYFWANQTTASNDWRVQVGFDPDDPTSTSDSIDMLLIRDNGAQQAEAGQFDAAVTLSAEVTAGGANPDTFLYRTYAGRKTISSGSPLDVFIDDFSANTTTRAWYDGVGYALVSSAFASDGDYDDDGDKDAADIDILWKIVRGTGTDPNNNDTADLDGSGLVNEDDVDTMLASKLTAGTNRAYGDADLSGGTPELTDFNLWRTGTGGWAQGDFDGSGGTPELTDFNLWRTGPTEFPTSVGSHGGGGGGLVPEPATLVLMGLALPALLVAARRRKYKGRVT